VELSLGGNREFSAQKFGAKRVKISPTYRIKATKLGFFTYKVQQKRWGIWWTFRHTDYIEQALKAIEDRVRQSKQLTFPWYFDEKGKPFES
jgi:hypothetical protein